VRTSGGSEVAAHDLFRECIKEPGPIYSWGAAEEIFDLASDEPIPHEDLLDKGNQRLKGNTEIAHSSVLPAFGAFTGMHPIRPAHGERVFAIADAAVSELPIGVDSLCAK
jgi:hypothetical protein